MITKFDSSYYGTADMEDARLQPASRSTTAIIRQAAVRQGPLRKVVGLCPMHGPRGASNTFWMAEHHFQPEGDGADPETS